MKPQLSGSGLLRYIGAVSAVLLATIVRFPLTPIIGFEYPFQSFWLAVTVAGYLWGVGPGITVSLAGLLSARFFFIAPLRQFTIPSNDYSFRALIYLAYCALILLITSSLRKEHAKVKAAQQRAKEAEERVHRILDSIHDGFAVFDDEWRLLRLNPRALEIIRKPPQDLDRKPAWEILPGGAESQASRALKSARADRMRKHFEEFDPESKLWIEGDAYPAQEGTTVFFRDITARKQAQLELQQKSEQLQQSNQELEQFAYAAAHDLQEPLRAITARAKEAGAKDIEFSAERMRQLIGDLLTYSRYVTRKETQLGQVDSRMAVEMALLNCSSGLLETNAHVDIGVLPAVYGNTMQLAQVFQNLISNAIKYRSAAAPCIRITGRQDHGEVTFAVADNGIGIDPKYAERIFGVFKRLHGPEIPGTGIGLAICKRIVENHGGRIWLEPGQGGGSTFVFTMPAA